MDTYQFQIDSKALHLVSMFICTKPFLGTHPSITHIPIFFLLWHNLSISSCSFSYSHNVRFQLSTSRTIRWGERLAVKYIELTSFLALWCVFTLTKIRIYPLLENHNTSYKVKLYLENMSQKELESCPLSKSLLLPHFYSGQPSIQWMNSIIS